MESFDLAANSIGKSCEVCKQSKHRKLPSILGFIVLILPKCPFCFVAYSSALTICGSSSLITHHTDWGAYFAIGLAIIALLCIGYNYRGTGTKKALFTALIGLIFILFGIFKPTLMLLYYLGSLFLLLAAYYNGSGFSKINNLIHFLMNKFKITFS